LLLHYAIVRKVKTHNCCWDGFETYYIPLESSFQDIAKGVWFACVLSGCTGKINNHPCFLHVTALCHTCKAKTHILLFRWFGNILYTIKISFQEILQGCIHLCFISLQVLNKLSSMIFCISLHEAIAGRSRHLFVVQMVWQHI